VIDEPMDPERERVGRSRLEAFLDAQGRIHAECMSLTLSMGYAAHAGYSDEALQAIGDDAIDLRSAAEDLATLAERMADEWRQQRVADERRKAEGAT
jgi:hypothetical protein